MEPLLLRKWITNSPETKNAITLSSRYLLSYAQNFLLLRANELIPEVETLDNEIDVEDLKTHDILLRAK